MPWFAITFLALQSLRAQSSHEADADLARRLEAELASDHGKSGGRETARAFSALGRLYHRLGQYPRAEQAFRRSVSIYHDVAGNNDPELARSRNDLASLYVDLGRCAEAEHLL